jgi:predicted peptidase
MIKHVLILFALAATPLLAFERWDTLYEPQVFEGLPCRVMKPIDFDSKQSYPLILSLHGAGGKGTNNDKQLKDWNK